MDIKKATRIYIIIDSLLVIIFFVNKELLRPYFSDTFLITSILGSLPNMIGAYIFSLIPINKALRLDLNKGRKVIFIYSILVFVLLTSEEIFPILSASTTFDYYDILASGLGSLLAILFYNYLSIKIEKTKSTKIDMIDQLE